MARPYFKGMTDEQLKQAYWDARNGAASWANIASVTPQANRKTRGKIAGGVFSNLRDLDLIVAIARQRKLNLFS